MRWLSESLASRPDLVSSRPAQIKLLRQEHGLSYSEAFEIVRMVARGEQAPITIEELRALLQEESEKRRIATKKLRWSVGIGAGILLLLELAVAIKNGKFDGIPIFGLVFLSVTIAAGSSGKLKLAAREAAYLQDKRSLGALIEMLDCGEPEIVDAVRPAINQIMRSLEPGDVTLDVAQKAIIHRLLTQEKDTDLVIGLLAGLRQVGDSHDMEMVERVADGTMSVPKKDREQVASLARMALADIRLNRARVLISERTGPIVVPDQVLREVELDHQSTS